VGGHGADALQVGQFPRTQAVGAAHGGTIAAS
jgi:hypothetical protein